jgi:MFS transporter, AAHS family, 4-hydroxybenzoate transporter
VVGSGLVDKGRFTPAQLFKDKLAAITALLWVAYMCSSAVVFLC